MVALLMFPHRAQHRAGGIHLAVGKPEGPLHLVDDRLPPGVHRPRSDVGQGQVPGGECGSDQLADVRADELRHVARQGDVEALVADPPRHVLLAGGNQRGTKTGQPYAGVPGSGSRAETIAAPAPSAKSEFASRLSSDPFNWR